MNCSSRLRTIALLLLAVALGPGCSVRKLAINKAASALTGSGSTFTSDNDPEFVRDALPFSLKLMEGLLAGSPEHVGLLATLGSGFAQYSYAFIQVEAERVEDTDLDRSRELQERARNMYLRARDYCLRGLEVKHPGFTNALARDPRTAVAVARKDDVPLLYWTAASWAAAISQAKDDPALVGDLPKVEALIDRALALDGDWFDGTIHGFLVTFEMARPTGAGDPVERATRHFQRAKELGAGRLAGPYVAYAESVCIPKEDRAGFEQALGEALKVDVNLQPAYRVENLVLQRRARWLLGRVDKLFLPPLK